jgi:alpha-L-rhamnosidase
VPIQQQKSIMEKTYKNDSITNCSFYFRFYLAEAMKKAGLGDTYTDMLQPWQKMLGYGLTTFAEESEPSRSDCHAWSASPVYHFLELICGIQPGAPGFTKIKIAPELGNLEWVQGTMPHKYGLISMRIEKTKNGKLLGNVQLPKKLDGYFEWKGKRMHLKPGINKIDM